MAKYLVSMMCADSKDLTKEMRELNEAAIDGYHLDVMDGTYVPNFALGLGELKAIKELNDGKILDFHLMIQNPERYIDMFEELGADMISFHLNSTTHVDRLINDIKDRGIKVGIALNPSESLEELKYIITKLDYVLVMSVNPGFAGQPYVEYSDQKIKDLKQMIKEMGLSTEVILDGSASKERIEYMKEMDVDGFILGTSLLFGKGRSYKEIMEEVNK